MHRCNSALDVYRSVSRFPAGPTALERLALLFQFEGEGEDMGCASRILVCLPAEEERSLVTGSAERL